MIVVKKKLEKSVVFVFKMGPSILRIRSLESFRNFCSYITNDVMLGGCTLIKVQ